MIIIDDNHRRTADDDGPGAANELTVRRGCPSWASINPPPWKVDRMAGMPVAGRGRVTSGEVPMTMRRGAGGVGTTGLLVCTNH